jgi:NADPH:quinone reductase-like Zn-dependent oxidoreductase
MPFSSSRRARFVMTKPSGRVLRELVALVEEGKLRVVIDSEYPLDRLAEAHDRSRSGHAAGKIVVKVG